MKLLYSTSNETGLLSIWRCKDGNYYIDTKLTGQMPYFMLLPAKADEIRMALIAGFEPAKELNDLAATLEPPHPDD